MCTPLTLRYLPEHAEKMQWVKSAETCIGARKLRNLLVHEYRSDVELFLQALLAAREASEILISAVTVIEAEAESIGLPRQSQ